MHNFWEKLITYIKIKNRCIIGKETIVYRKAKIINNIGRNDLIVLGDNSHIKGELLLFGHGGKIIIGSYCYVGDNTRIWSAKNITIGNRVLISHNVNIFDNLTHPISSLERHRQFKSIISTAHPDKIDLCEKPIHIENDALIGCASTILKGVTIGEGAIVGAGSVVTKDVPPWTIVAGNPAKMIRKIPANER